MEETGEIVEVELVSTGVGRHEREIMDNLWGEGNTEWTVTLFVGVLVLNVLLVTGFLVMDRVNMKDAAHYWRLEEEKFR